MSNKIARVPANHVPKADARFPDFTPENRARVLELTKTLDRDGPAQRLADATRLSPSAFSAMIQARVDATQNQMNQANAGANAAAYAASARSLRRRRRWSFAPA